MTQILVFRIAGQDFGAEVGAVREVMTLPEVTALPHAKAPVVGVFNLRGQIATAVDGAQAFRIPRESGAPYSRVVVTQVERHLVGILVDAATGVITIDPEAVKPMPGVSSDEDGRSLAKGVIVVDHGAIVLVDPGAILDRHAAAIPAEAGSGITQNKNESVV